MADDDYNALASPYLMRPSAMGPVGQGYLQPAQNALGGLSLGLINGLLSIPQRAWMAANPEYLPLSDSESPQQTRNRALGNTAFDMLGLASPSVARAALSPGAAGELGIFGGPMAKTANQSALNRAISMWSNNRTPEEIWNETGWFQGADRKWRFEIPDNEAKWNLPRTLPDETSIRTYQDKAMTHPDLAAAYPDSSNLPVRYWRPVNPEPGLPYGVYYPNSPSYSVRDVREFQDPLSTALHELQHHVQGEEGFAQGGQGKDARNLAGEVEARNVQKRMKMTPEERRANPPWMTEDTPRDQQIVRMPQSSQPRFHQFTASDWADFDRQ